ncbi:MFS transporter [Frigidibacter sp. ROC022]|uniref:MFS transporter n=1 Tax=Frigidibacter sp. ROC022 TaxID=2971796 RepID=UPI00215A3DFC|nr:MFS transporter [Frigidibacter sp. ROC022]MCR8724233.1 MFS transporter [Frigidibacter sp. ROC022]
MKAGIAALVAGYVLSQFYRACLAVLTPVLSAELGATAGELSRASGMWFLCFAVMQLPVGAALDRFGPRVLTAGLLALGGGGGAALFALAQGPTGVIWAMALIGVGCSPVLMASYYIFARQFPPRMFATLGGAVVAAGSLGNVAGTVPLALMVEAIGWRTTLWGLTGLTLLVAAVILTFVRNPPAHESGGRGGSVFDILRLRVLWPLFPLLTVNYVVGAALRGLWVGPYMRDSYGMGAEGIGWVSLAMGLAMILGNLVYGPLDRLFGTRKWVILVGNALCGLILVMLAAWSGAPLGVAVALIALAGMTGASFPLIIAHTRAFAPPHLAGRAVTLMNLFSIAGAGVFQYASGWVFAASGGSYPVLFLFFGLPLLAGALVYAFGRDNLA